MGKNNNSVEKTYKKQPVDEEIIGLMSSPNQWTPAIEDLWLTQPAIEIMKRFGFPFQNKLPHVRKYGKTGFL
jgi:hypothetical protein